MKFAAVIVLGCALFACHGGRDDRNASASPGTSDAATECYDCDGLEGVIFNAQMTAAAKVQKDCGGGPVELVDKKRDGLRPSDYRCRR